MKRILFLLCFLPCLVFGQYRADRTRTNPNVADGNGYCFRGHLATASSNADDAEALFARMTTPPTAERKAIIRTFIEGAKAAGVWQKLDLLQVYAAADQQAALLNWIADTNNATAVNSPSFVADSGFAGNGSTSYINTNFNPYLDGVHYTQNSATFGYMCLSWGSESGVSNGVACGGSYVYSLPLYTLKSSMSINFGTFGEVQSGLLISARHYVIGSKSNTTAYLFVDNVQTSSSTTSVAPPNGNVYLGGTNTCPALAEANDYRYACCFLGAALDSTEAVALTTLLESYMDAIGCGILP